MTRRRGGWFVLGVAVAGAIAFVLVTAVTQRALTQAARVRQSLAAEQTALMLDAWERLVRADRERREMTIAGWGRLEARTSPGGLVLVARPEGGHAIERHLTDQ